MNRKIAKYWFSLFGILLLLVLIGCDNNENSATNSPVNNENVQTDDNTNLEPEVFELENKKIVFLGSSVTYGSASNGWSMCEYFEEYYSCEVVKLAVSGTTLVDNGPTSYVSRLNDSIYGIGECDAFICQLSTNDATQNKPLGTISESFDRKAFNTSEIIGAMEYIISLSKEVLDCPIFFYTGTKFLSPNYQAMVDALYELEDKWHIGIIDLWNDEEMNKVTANQKRIYMYDSIHPTRAGYRDWWGPKFAEYILDYFNKR